MLEKLCTLHDRGDATYPSFNSNIQTTPSKALYGYPPPLHISYFLKELKTGVVDTFLYTREATTRLLQHHLSKAQHRMESLVDHKQLERKFQIENWVFVKLYHIEKPRAKVLWSISGINTIVLYHSYQYFIIYFIYFIIQYDTYKK